MNNITLIGRVTADIELKIGANSGAEIAPFTLAVTRRGNKDGEKETDFIDCVAFDARAKALSQYVRKGDRLGVSGYLKVRPYTDNNGNKRKNISVICTAADFLTDKQADTAPVSYQEETAPYLPAATINDDLPF